MSTSRPRRSARLTASPDLGGTWERVTIVVETAGFNGRGWVDTAKGHPQSVDGRVIECFTRRNVGNLEIEITIG